MTQFIWYISKVFELTFHWTANLYLGSGGASHAGHLREIQDSWNNDFS